MIKQEENLKKIKKGMKFLKWVLKDFQLDPQDERYIGFINLDVQGFSNQKLRMGFIHVWDNPDIFKPIIKLLNLQVENWDRNEFVIGHIDRIHKLNKEYNEKLFKK